MGLKVSRDTIYEYMEYLKDISFIFPVKKFEYSLKKQEISLSKIYLLDNSFKTYLGFSFSKDIGHYYENIVFGELKRRGGEIYYFKNRFECDFIHKDFLKNKIIAYQVAYDITEEQTFEREIAGLKRTMENLGIKEGILINSELDEVITEPDKQIKILPLWKFLLSY